MSSAGTIRSVCHSLPPWVSDCFTEWPSKNCSFAGIEAEFHWQMLTILGFSIQFIKANSTEEMFHLIANGSADITCISKELTRESSQFGDPTVPIYEDYPIFILPDKGESSMDSNLLLSISHWSVWLTCLTLTLGCFIIDHFVKKMGRPEWNSAHSIIWVSYYLALGVVLGVCGNFLAVALSLPIAAKPIFGNLMGYSQLVASGQCRAILVETNLEYTEMKDLVNPVDANFDREIKKNLLQAYTANPPILVKTFPKLVSLIKSSSQCLIGIDWHMGSRFYEKKICNLIVYELYPKRTSYAFYTRKNWPHKVALDSLITRTSMEDLY